MSPTQLLLCAIDPDVLAKWLTAFQPIIFALLSIVSAVAINQIRTRVKDKHLCEQLEQLTRYAEDAVALVYMTYAKDRKDPSKPSLPWNEMSQREALDRATSLVKTLAPGIIDNLSREGEPVDMTIRSKVERAVLELNKSVTNTLAAPGARPAAVLLPSENLPSPGSTT